MLAHDIVGLKREEIKGNDQGNGLEAMSTNWYSGWMVAAPIDIRGGKVTIRARLMEIGRPYRFVWGGVEVFAIRRNDDEKVEFYTVGAGG